MADEGQLWNLVRLREVKPRPPVELLCGPLLPRGEPTVLYGDGDAGKSMLAAGLALSISSGVPVVPGWEPIPGPVLVLDFETHQYTWQDRIRRIADGILMTEIPSSLYYVRAWQDLVSGQSHLARIVDQVKPVLIVVDSMGFALAAERDGADPKDAVLGLHRALRGLGTTTLVIDHQRKGGGTYGSVYKVNAAREMFWLSAVKGGSRLQHRKANNRARLPNIDIRVDFTDPNGPISFSTMIRPVRDPAPSARSVRSEVIRLLDIDPSLNNAELTLRTGGKPGNVRRIRSDWASKRSVTRSAL